MESFSLNFHYICNFPKYFSKEKNIFILQREKYLKKQKFSKTNKKWLH